MRKSTLLSLLTGQFFMLAMSEDTGAGESFADQVSAGGDAPAAAEAPVSDDPNIEYATTAFHFRTEVVEIKDDAGNVTEKQKVKRPSLTAFLPKLTMEGVLAAISSGGKQADLVLEAVNDVIYSQAREIIAEAIKADRNVVLTPELLDPKKLSWETIANLPKAERRGAGIAAEVWAAFEENYVEVMAQVYPEKTAEQLGTAAGLLAGKFQKVKTNKPVIEALTGFLLQWYDATPAKDEFADVFQFLSDKSATLLAADETVMLQAL